MVDIDEMRRKAIDGSTTAQAILGLGYLYGLDIDVDYNEAFRWLTLASGPDGVSRAVVNLGYMFEQGLGTPKDVGEAIRQYLRVAECEPMAPLALGRIYAKGNDVEIDYEAAVRWYGAFLEMTRQYGVDSDETREALAYLEGRDIDEMSETKAYLATDQTDEP